METDQEEFDRRSRERGSGIGSGNSTPKPDPTVLTTEALLREINTLRTLIDQRINATESLFETKIVAGREGGLALRDYFTQEVAGLRNFHLTDIAGLRSVFHSEIEALKQDIQAMGHLRDEKLVTVQTQFDLIERQRVENKADTKAAVDAALAAAKEAVKEQTTASDRAITKSETATSEQLKQMNVTFTTSIQGIMQPIADLKDRVTALESIRLGSNERRVEFQESRGDTRGNIGMYVAIGTLFLAIVVIALAQLKP